ncbi:MAG: hypothetical protein ACLGIV_06700 [Actinomycetes bacterium]
MRSARSLIVMAALGIGSAVVAGWLPAAASTPSVEGAAPQGFLAEGSGNVMVRVPPVVFTEQDGWPVALQRGRPVEGTLRFAAGPGVTVRDVTVTAVGGRIDCPEGDRATEDYVTTLTCRLQPGVPAGAALTADRDATVVRLEVVTDDGTFSREFTHVVRDGRS